MDENFPKGSAEFKLTISHNTVTGSFTVEGHNQNRLVALGMLEYAKQLITRENAKQAMLDDMRNAPRIVPASGGPS